MTNYLEQWEQAKGQILLQAAQLEQRCIVDGIKPDAARKLSEEVVAMHYAYAREIALTNLRAAFRATRSDAEAASKFAMAYGETGRARECEGAAFVAKYLQETAADAERDLERVMSGQITFEALMAEFQAESESPRLPK